MSLFLRLRPITTTVNQLLSITQIFCPVIINRSIHIPPLQSTSNQLFASTPVNSLSKFAFLEPQREPIVHQYVNNEYEQEEKVKQLQQDQELKKKLRILFLTDANNSMSQAAYLLLTQMGHSVMIELALSSEQMQKVANELNPDLIICPFLTKVVPESLYTKFKTLIVHPGIVGDRGIHSLDWALLEAQQEWGVTVMEAEKEMDAGPIYATQNFSLSDLSLSQLTKSKVYRNKVVPAALQAIHKAVTNFIQQIEPIPLDYSNPMVKGGLKPTMKQSQCAINWEEDSARTIVRKISSRDSNPGLLDSALFGKGMYLYGAHIENIIKIPPDTPPKKLLGQRDGAILVSCKEGEEEAVWITHMKHAGKNNFKLPSTMLLERDVLAALSVLSTNFTTIPTNKTFNEIYYEQQGNVVCLHFEFYNGAMSTTQCQRLLQALYEIAQIDSAKVIILCGGPTYFSNGIHLNVIEAAKNQYNESWENINAIDDIVLKIMSITDKLIISVLQGSAGAGGVMMALAADLIYANSHTVLNPHYRTMGLFGSEYWTYNLPRRVGFEHARQITEACQPLSAKNAKEIGLIDGVLDETADEMIDKVKKITNLFISNDEYNYFIKQKKKEHNSLFYNQLAAHRSTELAKISENFRNITYHEARHSFVLKRSPVMTPWHLKKLGRDTAICVDGKEIANRFQANIRLEIKSLQAHASTNGLTPRSPGLACLLVSNRRDSLLYVQKKGILAASLGFLTRLVEIKDYEEMNVDKLEETILQQIKQWNNDPLIDGILVQLPLPQQLNHRRILDAIDIEKDVDGLHSLQLADLASSIIPPSSTGTFIPCTVRGILELLQVYDVKLPGKVVCIVGASKTVGLPLSLTLTSRGCTVTLCTVQTNNLYRKVHRADIVISSAGVAQLVKANWIRPGAIVIDAGITVLKDVGTKKMKICGDVEQNDLLWERASLVTPVPGGIGPITVTMLLQNTLDAYKSHLTRQILKTGQQ